MPRNFFYLYSEVSEVPDGPEHDPDNSKPIPAKGDTIVHKGRSWRVLGVALIRTVPPKRALEPPLEVLITLVPA